MVVKIDSAPDICNHSPQPTGKDWGQRGNCRDFAFASSPQCRGFDFDPLEQCRVKYSSARSNSRGRFHHLFVFNPQ